MPDGADASGSNQQVKPEELTMPAVPPAPSPAHSKSEYKRRVAVGDPSVLPPVAVPPATEPPEPDADKRQNNGANWSGWYDLDCAPLDGTLVQLLVRFDNHAIEDTNEPAATIGSCNDGEWHFVGWCWHTDEYTRGSGDLLGWLPMGAPAIEDRAQGAEPDVRAMSRALSEYMDEADKHGHQVSGADFGAGYRAGAQGAAIRPAVEPAELLVGNLVAATLAEEREGELGADDEGMAAAKDRFLRAKEAVLRALAVPAVSPEPVQTFIDQLDAEQAAEAWLRPMVPTDNHRVFWQLERFSFAPHDGRVFVLRAHDRIVAVTVAVRDSLNRTNLVKWLAVPAVSVPSKGE